MPRFKADRVVAHSAVEMLDLVADVENYPAFVPLCEALRISDRIDEGPRTVLIADMTIAYKVFRETFTTQVTVDREARTVAASYLEGPFRHLDSTWRFEPLGETRCRVHFDIDYEFRSRVLGAAMGAVFDRVFGKYSDAFAARADVVYGPAAVTSG